MVALDLEASGPDNAAAAGLKTLPLIETKGWWNGAPVSRRRITPAGRQSPSRNDGPAL